MKTYPQQHEPWRPDYPPVWNAVFDNQIFDVSDFGISTFNKRKNIRAFNRARSAIDKAMKP